jgi:hypothetical protein
MISLYSVLGLQEDAPKEAVDDAHLSLSAALEPGNFPDGSVARKQAERCLKAIENAYNTLSKPDLAKLYHDQREEYVKGEKKGDTRPRLGQLCVASGMITMDQLREAVDEQLKTGLPLGEVLQELHFISQAQLEGLLLGQEMIDVPSAVTDPIAVRLISLTLLSEDMALIAQMEKRAQGVTINEIVGRHGWIAPEVLDIVTKA